METFNNVINSGQLVLVDFFATWCQPCKAMHPILEQVKSVLGDRIRIIKVDVDKYGVTASQYRIQSVPTLMLVRNGEVADVQLVDRPVDELVADYEFAGGDVFLQAACCAGGD